jgi:predicted membrane-bound spermidine synthase
MGLSASRRTILGLFLISLSTLMYETLLTRIFSVTMWYHFAFAAISMAMLGMTAGAVMVYVFPNFFRTETVQMRLTQSGLAFSIAIVISFLTHLSIPFVTVPSLLGFYSIFLNFTVLAIPFIFSGITICLALTKYKEGVSRLYAADLFGAALGCLALVVFLQFADAPSCVIAAASLAAAGAWAFSLDAGQARLSRTAIILTTSLAVFAVLNGWLAGMQIAPLRLLWVKGEIEPPLLYEKWNSFSRIRVMGDPAVPEPPFGWGLSRACDQTGELVQLGVDIDAGAATVLTEFNGQLAPLEYLKCDVTNLAHYIRPDADVLVVGVGGGRDVLSALVFKQASVLGVEINENIINLLTERFGELTGHLDQYPNVRIVTDEARSFITRSPERFDIIQVSLIDTWAATASGAFVLSENSLYTVEAWDLFLDRLQPGGVLSFSRWYMRDQPYEMYRLTSLAVEALLKSGVDNPRDHIVIIRYMHPPDEDMAGVGIGTMLVSNEPFTEEDLAELERVASSLNFDIILSPHTAWDETFASIASGKDLDKLVAESPFDLAAPTDNRPFFFLMLRIKDALNPANWMSATLADQKAVTVLVSISLSVVALTLLSILIPLRMTTDRSHLKGSGAAFVYFAGIGLGFMLVEISQMQRLILFLGHPTYSLSVVLFTLLLASGLGSYTTQKITPETALPAGRLRLAGLLGMLVLFGLLTPLVTRALAGVQTPWRILATILLLFPVGIFMGMAFPLGIKQAGRRAVDITPWLWGINGAASVCASVLAVLIALGSGISTAFWAGVICYVVALAAWKWVGTGRE